MTERTAGGAEALGGGTPAGVKGAMAEFGEYPKLCVSDLAHAVFRYVHASKRPANIMAS